jgi:hypothetical protein
MVIKINTSRELSQEREEVFSIDDKAYTVLKVVPGNVGLQAMDKMASLGELIGVRWMMIELLGQEGYDALRTCPYVEEADILAIMEICRLKVFGKIEEQGKG